MNFDDDVDVDIEIKKERKKFFKKIFIILAIIGSFMIGIIGYGVYWAFIDMERLPKGEFLTEKTSPDGKYTLKAYLANGGATTAYSVRGELVFNNRNQKTKNVYWNYREDHANITWSDNHTVIINGHRLDVPNDKFDSRRR
ncbi:MAG: DUF5412 domain-containing protein [Candidatus Pristimantibacillus sp.]